VTENVAAGLILRHDSGSNNLAYDFQDEIKFLGIKGPPAFVRQPKGNGVPERVIKTLREQLLRGPALPDHRGTSQGARRVRRFLYRRVAAGAPWKQDTKSDQGRTKGPCIRSRHGVHIRGLTAAVH
jgi:hypothetical protein